MRCVVLLFFFLGVVSGKGSKQLKESHKVIYSFKKSVSQLSPQFYLLNEKGSVQSLQTFATSLSQLLSSSTVHELQVVADAEIDTKMNSLEEEFSDLGLALREAASKLTTANKKSRARISRTLKEFDTTTNFRELVKCQDSITCSTQLKTVVSNTISVIDAALSGTNQKHSRKAHHVLMNKGLRHDA
eukprot:c7400_g1_i1.p1 GENE.c7400_g1_i1~~c7400_g1_i1.p1  ORF type:complete len:187 (-),score=49.23 c7400_g1_i1:298-858(-)